MATRSTKAQPARAPAPSRVGSRNLPPVRSSAPLHYQVQVGDLHAHLYTVTLTIPAPTERQRVSLPVWIPGSYLVREFAKNLQGLQAHQGRRVVALLQLDKCTWQIACTPGRALTLRYQVYALDNSVRSAWLDATRGFFNGTSLFLRVEGQEDSVHQLELTSSQATAPWSVATGLRALKVNRRGWGSYHADDYHTLVDSPVELGDFWSGSFTACGVPHRFVVAGAPPSFDGAALLRDTQKICESELHFWHGPNVGDKHHAKPPHASYVFMLNATSDGYGGLEHGNSTALICGRNDLPRLKSEGNAEATKKSDGYVTLLGLISHEYFHTWNVKRLRPIEFAQIAYERENYTELLWFFEGFTSYFDDLLLRRAGLIDDASYLKLLNKTINQVHQTPGARVQSVAQASFDAWVKYYRQDENTPNATVSYYTKGALVALCLDLSLRSEGAHSLDQVMRALWQRCHGGPMSEADVLAVLAELSGRSYADEIRVWVHGKGDLPLRELLERHGVQVHDDPAQLAQTLGLRMNEGAALTVKAVLRGGAAEQAGFAAGDEWLGITAGSASKATSWRMTRLDDVPLYAGSHKRVSALVARDKRLLQLPLALPPAQTTWRLTIKDSAAVQRWLS